MLCWKLIIWRWWLILSCCLRFVKGVLINCGELWFVCWCVVLWKIFGCWWLVGWFCWVVCWWRLCCLMISCWLRCVLVCVILYLFIWGRRWLWRLWCLSCWFMGCCWWRLSGFCLIWLKIRLIGVCIIIVFMCLCSMCIWKFVMVSGIWFCWVWLLLWRFVLGVVLCLIIWLSCWIV